MRTGHGLVHLLDDRLVLMRPGNGEHIGITGTDAVRFDTEATGDDDAAVLSQRLPDGLERLLLGAVEEAASVDHDRVRPLIARRQLIALGAQLCDDAL